VISRLTNFYPKILTVLGDASPGV